MALAVSRRTALSRGDRQAGPPGAGVQVDVPIAEMSLSELSLVELTLLAREPRDENDDEFAAEVREELASRGGEAPEQVRVWLRARLDARERAGARHPTQELGFARVSRCACGAETRQLRHGFTETGALWNGHRCACRGWECTECGRLLEVSGSCCK